MQIKLDTKAKNVEFLSPFTFKDLLELKTFIPDVESWTITPYTKTTYYPSYPAYYRELDKYFNSNGVSIKSEDLKGVLSSYTAEDGKKFRKTIKESANPSPLTNDDQRRKYPLTTDECYKEPKNGGTIKYSEAIKQYNNQPPY